MATETAEKIVLNHFSEKVRSFYTETGPDKIIYPGKFEEIREAIRCFEVRDDDVYIIGFPKTGTRWAQEMTWLLLNDLNFKKAREDLLVLRSPFLEFYGNYDTMSLDFKAVNVQQMQELPSPRCIKTHMHWTMLPETIRSGTKKPKMIVTLREPEDVCTSFYHQSLSTEGFTGTWDEFCNAFLEGKIPYGPYWKHVLRYWEQRHRPNILFIKYNEMKRDLIGTIRNVATFIGKTVSDDDVTKLYQHLQFDNLKNVKSFNNEDMLQLKVNPFTRKGIVGDHKNYMSLTMIEEFRKKREEYFSDVELNFA